MFEAIGNFLKGINFHDFFKQLNHALTVISGGAVAMGILDPKVVDAINNNVSTLHDAGLAMAVLGIINWLLHNRG